MLDFAPRERSRRKYLAFDIETTKIQPPNQYDWKPSRPLGISCMATFLSGADKPLFWHGGSTHRHPANEMHRQEVQRLVKYLEDRVECGYTVVTWNGLGFDFDILAEESEMLERCRRLAINHVDMMFHAVCRLGHGMSLESAAKGMEVAGKDKRLYGALAPQFWAYGWREEVLEYVGRDVQTILELAEICEVRGFLRWVTHSGGGRKMVLPDGWLPVCVAKKLPITGRSWMWPHWSRTRFTNWLG
jgi:RNase_H superfamily